MGWCPFDIDASTVLAELGQHGPPTFNQWSLFVAGHAAEFFDAAFEVGVPMGSLSLSPSIDARRAIDSGNCDHALEILQEHINDLFKSEGPALARIVAVSFVDLCNALSNQAEAQPIRHYLQTDRGHFGSQTDRCPSPLITSAPRFQ